jgi:hypothetical protein
VSEACIFDKRTLRFAYGCILEIADRKITVNCWRVMALNRHAVRRRFEERFTAARMANEYVPVYNALLTQKAAGVVASQVESSETFAKPTAEPIVLVP